MSKTWKDYLDEMREKGFAKASPIARLIWSCEVGDIDQHASDDLIAITDELDALRAQRNDYMAWHVEQGQEIIKLRAELEYYKNKTSALEEYAGHLEYCDICAVDVDTCETGELLKAIASVKIEEVLPFTSPDPRLVTREEILAGG